MSSKKMLPKLVVFDLDYTLWPFWVDTHVTPPFRRSNGKIVDANGSTIKFYPEVPAVLQKLSDLNISMAVASRTSEIEGAQQLCELFGWNKYFKYKEIYPGCKVAHFNQFKIQTGYQLDEMLFFDDESRNITDLSALNVTCVLVKNGMSLKLLEQGMEKKGNVEDSNELVVQLYPETKNILEHLSKFNMKIAVASRISDIASAYQLINLFDIKKYFSCIEIYPTRKTLHFLQIKQKTGFDFSEMIFYDDDVRNLKCIERLGVEVQQVVDGLKLDLVRPLMKKICV